jgi:leucyl-tRNA synthetase
MPVDFDEVESRWQERWDEAGAYEPEVDPDRESFFATYPYSYMNSLPHVGHAYTMLRADLKTRYERMKGKNTLFPFAYHVTGTPIVAAADRIAEGEASQVEILEDQGIPEEEIPTFGDPEHWIEYFPREWRQDARGLGLGIDWRREFHTTELNPAYDAFIRWQFRRLRDQGLVEKGRHPVVWCPDDETPVADHDRMEGEGETPESWTLVKLRLVDAHESLLEHDVGEPVVGEDDDEPTYLVAATLRPDTMFGQTNAWVDPAGDYVVARVDGERWILNDEARRKLGFQKEEVETVSDDPFEGSLLVNATAHAPARDAEVPVLPARFVDHDRGTGVVTSVPSDAPYDLIALRDLAEGRLDFPTLDDEALEEARRRASEVDPVPIIATDKFGDVAAEAALDEYGPEDQTDEAVLDEATEAVYQAGFYGGTLLERCGPFAGEAVHEAKEEMHDRLVDRGEADVLYETSGHVQCRCLATAVVKMVSDQWFLRYGDEDWKETVHGALDDLEVHPEDQRKQFEYVVDWLDDWACARTSGLGTRLPWDEEWIIESLSDSTIYMAYYTLAPYLEEGGPVDPDDLHDGVFDHVLLDEGTPEEAAQGTVTEDLLEEMREAFRYWYPVDFRNSGKDLVQNHLTFYLFNHVAVWDDEPELWPEAVGVNGWVMVDGEKMSKSKGNFITLREALEDYGATATRMTLANAGEGVDDANFDLEFAEQVTGRLERFHELATDPPGTRAGDRRVDDWFRSALQERLEAVREHMEATRFRSALKAGWFDLQRLWNWYLRRAEDAPQEDVLETYVDVQTRVLTPFAPHLAEEIHEARGGDGLALDAPWPEPDPDLRDREAEAAEAFVQDVLDDVREILQVTGIDADRVILYTAPDWKQVLHDEALDLAREDALGMGALMDQAMGEPEVREHKDAAPDLARDLVDDLANLGEEELDRHGIPIDERAVLEEAEGFLAREVDAEVEVHDGGDPDAPDPGGKAGDAAPRRPGIYVG